MRKRNRKDSKDISWAVNIGSKQCRKEFCQISSFSRLTCTIRTWSKVFSRWNLKSVFGSKARRGRINFRLWSANSDCQQWKTWYVPCTEVRFKLCRSNFFFQFEGGSHTFRLFSCLPSRESAQSRGSEPSLVNVYLNRSQLGIPYFPVPRIRLGRSRVWLIICFCCKLQQQLDQSQGLCR